MVSESPLMPCSDRRYHTPVRGQVAVRSNGFSMKNRRTAEIIIGKQITGIAVASNTRSPCHQLFIAFSDGTYFEIWGDSFICAGGVGSGGIEAAVSYARKSGAQITATYGGAEP